MISPGNTQLPAVISLLPSVSSMLLLAPTTLPGFPGGQCDPCPAASCVCLCEQVPRTVPPTLKPPSGASTREAAERCSEHRLDGSVGCPAPQLSSAQLTGSASSTRQHFQGKETSLVIPTPLPSQGIFTLPTAGQILLTTEPRWLDQKPEIWRVNLQKEVGYRKDPRVLADQVK